MRLPVSAHPLRTRTQFARAGALALLCLFAVAWRSPRVVAQDQPVTATARERMHQSEQWAQIQPHLPDPATATPQTLEMQADILRARRFPEDAMDYYRYAIARGGNVAGLTNKLGLAELEMSNIQLARVYFQKAVKLDRKNADAWNNLGAAEFVDGNETERPLRLQAGGEAEQAQGCLPRQPGQRVLLDQGLSRGAARDCDGPGAGSAGLRANGHRRRGRARAFVAGPGAVLL